MLLMSATLIVPGAADRRSGARWLAWRQHLGLKWGTTRSRRYPPIFWQVFHMGRMQSALTRIATRSSGDFSKITRSLLMGCMYYLKGLASALTSTPISLNAIEWVRS